MENSRQLYVKDETRLVGQLNVFTSATKLRESDASPFSGEIHTRICHLVGTRRGASADLKCHTEITEITEITEKV